MHTDAPILEKLAFGWDAESGKTLGKAGQDAWLEDQLAPPKGDDPACRQRLESLTLRIRYQEKEGPAVDELRPLRWLNASMRDLATLADPAKSTPGAEKNRPRWEVTAATLLRAVHGRYQLREVLCDFWHNHFSVNAADHAISIALPVYDREVIRRHCLGNFRELLEAVGKSTAMLYSLNNRSSRAGAANENYARELFELHTLGRDAYLNGLYNRWRDVPGALQGKPAGYIDQDVYEAARAFTGWAVADGSHLGGGQHLPRTGEYTYVESWHDQYQKRVLGHEIDAFGPPESDGRIVLDLAARHPATAQYVCHKLCQRLVQDAPPASLVERAVKVWVKESRRPDQIARVVRAIAQSPELANSRGAKVKRPLELVAGFMRATGMDFTPAGGLFGEIEAAGQRLFGWPTPTGHPDLADYWLGANIMRRRWTLIAGLSENWWGTGVFEPLAPWQDRRPTAAAFLDYWLAQLYGVPPAHLKTALLESAQLGAEQAIPHPGIGRRLVAWAAMAPEYQLR